MTDPADEKDYCPTDEEDYYVDPKSHELAQHFLASELIKEDKREIATRKLSIVIQKAVEDFCTFELMN